MKRKIGEKEKILLVDDEVPILNVMTEILGQYGYDIVNAQSGERAIEIIKEQKVS